MTFSPVEILFRHITDPVASWSVSGIRWAVEFWCNGMAYPIGQAWVTVVPRQGDYYLPPFVDWMSVDPEYRRMGVGTALLKAIKGRWPDVTASVGSVLGELFLEARKDIVEVVD